ncbi:MAG: hypothetical protein AAF720_08140 [Pseudomonadota bacterium]
MKTLYSSLSSLLKKFGSGSSSTAVGSNARNFAKKTAEKIADKEKAALSKDAEKNKHKRKEARTDISAIAELAFPDRGFSLDGVIVEASTGGLTFRPAAHYIEERVGEQIQVRVIGVQKNGIIRATRVTGYGIQLFDSFSELELSSMRAKSVDLSLVNPNANAAA